MIELGTKPEFTVQRDAVHVSVMTVQVADRCWVDAGDKVCFTNDSLDEVVKAEIMGQEFHAIVDPFYECGGSWVNIILRPGFVKNMRHNFDIDVSQLNVPAKGSEEDTSECRFC